MHEKEITKQNDFYQSRMNEAKLGAYYTDWQHCQWIHELLEFPEDEEVCCLEPAIGDASAILTVTGKKERDSHIKIYGVELNKNTLYEVLENPLVDECIHADFLTGIVVSHRSFSFCFANPPYGTTKENKRLETEFLRKTIPYLTDEAVMVYVIPQYVANDLSFLKIWCTNFTTCFQFKFHQSEYEKWKQVVLIGRKKKEKYDKEALFKLQRELEEERIRILPEIFTGERIKIGPSNEKNVKQFLTKEFDAERAVHLLLKSPLSGLIGERTKVKSYTVDNLNRPPILPCNGQLYLLAVTGGGQGKVGNEESKDLHLQRGVAKVVSKNEIVTEEETGKMKEIVKSYTQISFNIVENDGTIRTLQ